METSSLFRTDTLNTTFDEPPPSYKAHFKLNSSHLYRIQSIGGNIAIVSRDPTTSSYWLKKSGDSEEDVLNNQEYILLKGGKEGEPIISLTSNSTTTQNPSSSTSILSPQSSFTITALSKDPNSFDTRTVTTLNKHLILSRYEFLNLLKSKVYVWKNVDLTSKDMICNEKGSINIVAYLSKPSWRAEPNFKGNLSIAPGHDSEIDLIVASSLGLEVFGTSKHRVIALP